MNIEKITSDFINSSSIDDKFNCINEINKLINLDPGLQNNELFFKNSGKILLFLYKNAFDQEKLNILTNFKTNLKILCTDDPEITQEMITDLNLNELDIGKNKNIKDISNFKNLGILYVKSRPLA
ncbi:Hypothetical protein KVN_LOCUS33 [uncultured virus]|nr:Hypothetical protein KVN_LOCUS33 [uncultured virus]